MACSLDFLQGKTEYLIPVLISTINNLQDLKKDTSLKPFFQPLLNALIEIIKKRFRNCFNIEEEGRSALVSLSHPLIKASWVALAMGLGRV